MTAPTRVTRGRFALAPRWMLRWGIVLAGTLSSGACVIPEYYIDGAGGGSTGGSSTDSGGGQGDGGGTQSGDGGSADGGTGGTSDGGTGGTEGDGGAPSGGGTGGISPDWSCADEESHLPSYYSNGTWCGHRWTFKSPHSGSSEPTTDPPCATDDGTDCFRDSHEFLTAEIPASDHENGVYPVVGIGMPMLQPFGTPLDASWTLEGYGISVEYAQEGPQAGEPVRVQLIQRVGGAEKQYCTRAASGAPLAWDDFRLGCWNSSSTERLAEGDVVDAVQILITSIDVPLTVTKLDLQGLTFLEEEVSFTCDGCAVLFSPLSDGMDEMAEFTLELDQSYDLTLADDGVPRVTARVFVETEGDAGGLQLFLRSANGSTYYSWSGLGAITGWYELTIYPQEVDDLNGFNARDVERLGFVLNTGTPTASQTVADTTVYVDSVTFENIDSPPPDFTFSTEDSVPVFTQGLPGSEVSWRAD